MDFRPFARIKRIDMNRQGSSSKVIGIVRPWSAPVAAGPGWIDSQRMKLSAAIEALVAEGQINICAASSTRPGVASAAMFYNGRYRAERGALETVLQLQICLPREEQTHHAYECHEDGHEEGVFGGVCFVRIRPRFVFRFRLHGSCEN